jgi:predicted DsbA family dithiol-disulfide isomerase
MSEQTLVVDVWTDVMCPYCYLGTTLLTQVVEQFDYRESVQVRHHSYQLMPDLPGGSSGNVVDLLVRERGLPREHLEAANARIAAQGISLGLEYRFDQAIATNTRSAHRLIHYAASEGHQHAMVERLFRAYFTDGLSIGEHHVLAGLAAEVGLDRDKTIHILDSDSFTDEVDADIAQARELGIAGVPTMVFAGGYVVSGAQPAEAYLQALTTTWDEMSDQ